MQATFCNLRYVGMTKRFTIMSFVYSYGYIESYFVLMEVISVSNDWIWLIDVIK